MSVASANVSRVSGLLAASGAELARLTDATLLRDGAAPIRGAVVDSRRIAERRGALFVALPVRRQMDVFISSTRSSRGRTHSLLKRVVIAPSKSIYSSPFPQPLSVRSPSLASRVVLQR